MWGALSDKRMGLLFARVRVNSSKSFVSIYNLHFTCYYMYVYTIYTRPQSAQAQYGRSCPIIIILLSLILRPTVSRPVCLGIKHPFFYYCLTVAGLLMWDALSDERTGLSFTIAPGPRHHSHFQVRLPWDS
jgi:hypothetical protein